MLNYEKTTKYKHKTSSSLKITPLTLAFTSCRLQLSPHENKVNSQSCLKLSYQLWESKFSKYLDQILPVRMQPAFREEI